MQPPEVILGSSSKWRQALFAEHFAEYSSGDMKFNFPAADIDEKAIRHHVPEEMVLKIAHGKADAIAPHIQGSRFLICADQVVRCGGVIREKPETEEEARYFLDTYRNGEAAECINGVVVVDIVTGQRFAGVEIASVKFKMFSDDVIDAVISRKDVFLCAGGFVVEDPDLSVHVDRVVGSMESVQGLPLLLVKQLLFHAKQHTSFPKPTLPPNHRVTHVLFDMDGLLLDTEACYTHVQKELLKPYGMEFTWELKEKMMGKTGLEASGILVNELNLHHAFTPQQYLEEREKGLMVLFEKVAMMPGAARLIRHLKKHKIPIALATASSSKNVAVKTGHHREIFDLFDVVVTGSDVKNGKPDPEIFLTALEKLGGEGSAGTTLVFEDAPLGVDAAVNAGMHVVMVPDHNLSAASKGKSSMEIGSLYLFDPVFWGLPPFDELSH